MTNEENNAPKISEVNEEEKEQLTPEEIFAQEFPQAIEFEKEYNVKIAVTGIVSVLKNSAYHISSEAKKLGKYDILVNTGDNAKLLILDESDTGFIVRQIIGLEGL